MNSESVSEGDRAKEIFDKIEDRLDREGFKGPLDNLKREINNVLWCYLPRKTTIGKAEDIACVIFDMISEEWDRNRE